MYKISYSCVATPKQPKKVGAALPILLLQQQYKLIVEQTNDSVLS